MYTHNEVSSSVSTKCTNSDSVVTSLIPSHWIEHNLRVYSDTLGLILHAGVRVNEHSIVEGH